MNTHAPDGPEPYDALSAIEADFQRVRQLTIEHAEAWLVANDAVATRDGHYDASFLFHDQSYHTQMRVTFSRGHNLFEVLLSWRIDAEFQVVEGPAVLEFSERRVVDGTGEKERTMERGVIKSVIDCGTIVQVVIDTDDHMLVLAADGNLFRRAEAECGSLHGLRVQFSRNGWNGLEWFVPLD